MRQEGIKIIDKIKRRWLFNKLIALLFLIVPTVLLVVALSQVTIIDDVVLLILTVVALVVYILLLKPWPNEKKLVIRYLEQQYPWFEYSIDLFYKQTLNKLEKVQLSRISKRLENNVRQIVIPGHPEATAFGILLSIIGSFVLLSFDLKTPEQKVLIDKINEQTMILTDSTVIKRENIVIDELIIEVSPPPYTGIKPFTSSKLNLKVPQDSKISLKVKFSGIVDQSQLVFNDGTTALLSETSVSGNSAFVAKSDMLFQLRFSNNQQNYTSPYFSLEVIPDDKPNIEISGIERVTTVNKPDTIISLSIEGIDDYGISAADLVTTVSSGEGEAVKFREKRRSIAANHNGRSFNHNISIDLKGLGMTFGDELYFYVELTDNKFPQSQFTRSTTYIIEIPDTTETSYMEYNGMSADLMPEYFRSQRQIIIDSEKLLKEKSTLSDQAFNTRSNSLAHDQKALRLRYGQFIGIEDDSGIATQPDFGGDGDMSADDYTHDHDHEEAHAHHDHDHDEDEGGEEEEDPLEAYMHVHDSEEQSTFLFKSVKAKLRAALALMWDAELHLRMNDPRSSLPYQYKTLKLIKEIQNHARIYVERIGFEPPPVKESSRLTGELDEANSVFRKIQEKEENPLNDLQILLNEKYLGDDTSGELEVALDESLLYLGIKARENPLQYLEIMEAIRLLIADQSKGNIQNLRHLLITVTGRDVVFEPGGTVSGSSWNERYLEKLRSYE